MTNVGNASEWAQFGLAGRVIFALFVLVGYILKIGIDKHSEAAKNNAETMKEIRDDHRKERAEWRGELREVVDIFGEKVRVAILEMGKKDE